MTARSALVLLAAWSVVGVAAHRALFVWLPGVLCEREYRRRS